MKIEMKDRVSYSEDLTADFESLSSSAWEKMKGHPKFISFMQERLSAKCVVDFWYHVKYACYHHAMAHYDEQLHGPEGLAGFLQDWTREVNGVREPVNTKCLFWAREHCKTQMTMAWDAWNFARNPNHRLLVRAFNASKAQEILGGVREMLDSPSYRRMYSWVRPKTKPNGQAEEWRADKFRLVRDESGVRVPSAEAHGVDGQPTGGHFNHGHYDDFEVDANASSEILRDQMRNTWLDDVSLFLAGSQRILCGTPWHKRALVYPIMRRQDMFADHDYDVSVQSCLVPLFPAPFTGEECTLEDDRMTVRDPMGGFPVLEGDLRHCEARVTFFDPSTGDVVEEIREVTASGGTWFRVSRPFPEMLGAPIRYVVGNEKPAAPNRFTLDSVDWIPTRADRHGKTVIPRKSLHAKKQEMGSMKFSAQFKMQPVDASALVLNPDFVTVVPLSDVPVGSRQYFRSCDFASSKKTNAATAIVTGFWMPGRLYIQHIAYKNQMDTLEKMWELVSGVRRVENWGGVLRYTTFETAHIETVIGELLPKAERDPVGFFKGSRFQGPAETMFGDNKPVRVARRFISRGGLASKVDRICQQQPYWEQGAIHLVEGCPYGDFLLENAREFHMATQDSFDLLDALTDLVVECKPVFSESAPGEHMNHYLENQRKAQLRSRLLRRTGLAHVGWSG